jgi:predicted O-methyltransferase YrrM
MRPVLSRRAKWLNPVKAYRKSRWKTKVLLAGLRHYRRRRALIALLPKKGVGAEIGVWKGDFSARLLRGAQPRKLYLIDPWQHSSHAGAWYAQKDHEDMARIREAVIRRFAHDERVVVMPVRSLDGAEQVGQLDWAYLDGDHTYDAVSADLRTFWPLIRDGGCLAGDDYGIKGWWDDGVTRSVDEFSASIGCEKTIIGSQFLLRKGGDA